MKHLKAPFAQYGNKSNDIEDVTTHLPVEFDTFVDVFGGSACVSWNIKRLFPTVNVLYNDLSTEFFTIVDGLVNENSIVIDYMTKMNDKVNGADEKRLKALWNDVLQSSDKYKGLYFLTYGYKQTMKPNYSKNRNICRKRGFSYLSDYGTLKLETYNLDFRILVEKYRGDENAVIYMDPPYILNSNGSPYSVPFNQTDFQFIIGLLHDGTVKAKLILHYEFSGYIYDMFRDKIKMFRPKNYTARTTGNTKFNPKYMCIITNF